MTQKRSFLFLTLLLIGLIGTPAFAESATVLSISVDRGTPITLSAPAANVFIANPDIADIQVMSPTSVMVFGKKTGTTTLMATDNGGHTLLNRTVVVSQDLADLRHELATAIPGNKINAECVPDGIVLTGTTRDPLAVEDARKIASRYITKDGAIINRIQILGSNQVMLRVRFAEISRNVEKQFGINWDSAFTSGGFIFGLATGAVTNLSNPSFTEGTSTINATGNGTLTPTSPTAALELPFTRTGNTDAVSMSHQGGRFSVNNLLDALATDGLVTMLAEPNLTAMSGETANFLAGGQVPVITPQQNGSFSVQYVSYGISLEFTPTLVGENRINLHVKPEVSEPSSVGEIVTSQGTITAFTTRKAETTVELGSGQSFAIAGLLDNSQDQAISKFPFLGDVPVLGPLFRSTDFQNNQSELIIVVTPYVVKAGNSEQAMALPMDGYSPPTDSQLFFGLRNNNSDPNARPMSGTPKAAPIPPPPAPNPTTGMIEPSAIQPSPDAPTAKLSDMGVDLPPENGSKNDKDTSSLAIPLSQLGSMSADSLSASASATHDNAPPIPDPVTPAAPASASPPVKAVTPVSATIAPIAKSQSSSSASSNGFILE